MTINIHSIKPRGRVSVTLSDGTQYVNAEVEERNGVPWLLARGFPLYYASGDPNPLVVSVDAYTPPAPAWFTPSTFAILDSEGREWRQQGGQYPNGLFASQHYSCVQPDDLEARYGPCTILAVYAEKG